MSLVYWLQQPGGALLDITDRCRLYKADLKENAEEGSVAVSSITIDDPDGDLEMYGHRVFAVEETTAIDPDDRFIYVGFIGEVKTERGPYRTGASRQYVCDVSDPNTILNRRVMLGVDTNRPAESDVARIQWVLDTNETELIEDSRYVSESHPYAMDANDYLTQDELAVFDDCSQQSGKNYFVTYFGDVIGSGDVDKPWGLFSLWYDFPAGAPGSGDITYDSTASLTNILSEVDVESGAFYIGLEAETNLSRDPMRIYSGIVVPYKDSYVTGFRKSTADTFALRDKTMSAPNVNTKATAQARLNRYLVDLATPEDRATVKTTVPRSLVNLIRPGMQVPVHVSHWSGYQSDYVDMRVLSRRVVEISEGEDDAFELTLELSRSVPGPPPSPVYCELQGSGGPYPSNPGDVNWANPGDTPGPGWEHRPTVGMVEPTLVVGTPTKDNRPWAGITVTGTGTVDVRLYLTTIGVMDGTVEITVSITLNGTPVASQSKTNSGHLKGWADDFLLTTTGLSVSPGDLIEADIGWTGPFYFGRTPSGTGQHGESLAVTGGSLA